MTDTGKITIFNSDINLVMDNKCCFTFKKEIDKLKKDIKELKAKSSVDDEKIRELEYKVDELETKSMEDNTTIIELQKMLNKTEIIRVDTKYKLLVSDVFKELNTTITLLLEDYCEENKEFKSMNLNDIMYIYTFPMDRTMIKKDKIKLMKFEKIKDILPKLYNEKFTDKWNWNLLVKLYQIKKERNGISHFIKDYDSDIKRNGKLLYIYDKFTKKNPLDDEFRDFRKELNELIKNRIKDVPVNSNIREYDKWFNE